jgi:hypothetical protein
MTTLQRTAAAFATVIVASSFMACTTDTITETKVPVSQLIWNFALNDHAVMLAVGDAHQLVGVSLTSTGDTVRPVPRPVYRSSDSTKVTVDSTGRLTAVAATNGVSIYATVRGHELTYADTTVVLVTPTRRPFKSLAFANGATGSATIGMPAFFAITCLDSADSQLTDVPISYRSPDGVKALIFGSASGAQMLPVRLGDVRIIASTSSYGVTVTDTLVVTVGLPLTGSVSAVQSTLGPVFQGPSYGLATGGVITFSNYMPTPITIRFDDSTHVEGGNITNLATNGVTTRKFLAAGTYIFRDPVTGATGKVLVGDQ